MKTKILLLFIFYLNISFAQELKTELVSKTTLEADSFIGVDELENIYFIKNNVLYKKNSVEVLNYSNVNLGMITSVNILNPFKIILFYRDFNSVIILDNKLNELTNKIDFTKETLFNNALFVGVSSENNLWLYADDNKLHLYNYQHLTEQVQTQAITFYQNDFVPISIISTYKYVWLFSKSGIIQFNEYGNFIQNLNIENISDLYPFRKGFIYLKDNALFFWENKRSVPISLNYNQTIKNLNINNYSVNIFDGKYLYQYRLIY